MRTRPAHGGYPGTVRVRTRRVPLAAGLDMVDGMVHCSICGNRSRQEPNPAGGDSWYYRCPNGHQAWVGK